jgi:hypothetical protein
MGLGFQRLLQLKVSPVLSITLAPILSLSICSILLGFEVKLGHAIKDVYLFNWIIVITFSLVGLTRQNFRSMSSNIGLLILCFLLPIALMFNYFWFGLVNYLGSTVADGWTYIAVGQYLWEYPRGTEGHLIPLFQYAASFNSTRFITSALLAFLSPLSITENTQLIANAYLAWIFFIFTSSCAFFALTQHIGKYIYPYLILTVFSGWFILLLKNNNFDHAAFLGFLPVIAGGFVLFNHQKWVWSILLAVIISASLYIYPEMSPPIVFGTGLFFIAAMIKNKKIEWFYALLIIGLIMCLLLPYLNEFIRFLFKQSNQLNLPNDLRSCPYFNPSMLLPSRMLQSFWGQRHNLLGNITAIICTVLFARGLFVFYKEKRFAFLIFLTTLLIGACIMIFNFQYSYGAFKFISISWWLILFAMIVGTKSILTRRNTKISKIICIMILITYIFSGMSSIYGLIQKPGFHDTSPLRSLSSIKSMTGNASILVNINNDILNEWAMYFLKDYKIKVLRPPRFMVGEGGERYMNNAISIDPKTIKYIVTDNAYSYQKNQLLWSNDFYYLWKNPR